MGGGSSVMGMVAYRGTPDDYAEWQALGAAGWGWDDVLPYYRKLESDFDFDGALHGKDGPVPIRRTKIEDWAPLAKAVHAFAQERQIPFIADMNARFSRRLWRRADEQLAGQARARRRSAISTPMCAAAPICTILTSALVDRPSVRRTPRHRRHGHRRRRDKRVSRPRDHRLARRHSFAGLLDARRARPGAGAARARHRGARRSSGRRRKPLQSRHYLHRPAAKARRAAGRENPAASDVGVPLFLGPARRAASRHVSQCAVQDLVEPARPPSRQSRAVAAQADGARPCLAGLTPTRPRYPRVEFNFTGHELDLKRFMQGFRRCVDILAHEAVRAMTRLTFPVKFNDRLRRLNRITPANKIKSAAIAALIDIVPPLAGPIFATLADRRVDLASVSRRTTTHWRIISATMSPAHSIRSAPAAWARRTIAMR